MRTSLGAGKRKTACVHAMALLFWCNFSAPGAAHAGDSGNAPEHGRSAGCGANATGAGKFTSVAIRVLDRDRTYHLFVPDKYDPNRAYPLVFRWHGWGGDGLSGGLGIEFSSGNDAIVVGADGLGKTWDPATDANDLAFFDAMFDAVAMRYCIDRDRVYSYGYSVGAFFTNRLACERGGRLRASAAVAGGPWEGECSGKAAAWFLHDTDDKIVPISQGWAARDQRLAANGCSPDAVDQGAGCVRYQGGCAATPVVWCQTGGFSHDIRGDIAPAQVWKFFLDVR